MAVYTSDPEPIGYMVKQSIRIDDPDRLLIQPLYYVMLASHIPPFQTMFASLVRNTRFLVPLLVGFVAGLSHAQNQVAFDDLGNSSSQPHLWAGSDYTWPSSVPATVTDRTIAFGTSVTLAYGSAVPSATYQAVIVLSSDGVARGSLFTIDGQQMGSAVTTAPNTQQTVTIDIPAQALVDGKFELSIANTGVNSPNAAVGNVTILSSSTTALTVVSSAFDASTIQYTPIPFASGNEPAWSQSLNGTWKFAETAPTSFANPGNPSLWADIEVPGQWRNQGHNLPAQQATAYYRAFDVPAAWNGRKLKLRFDAVFSQCEVYVNGTYVGNHLGGFTPFELDITNVAQAGNNTLALRVTSGSLADTMASASMYACHQLGGISRDVTLFSVPDTHLKDVFIRTDFDAQFVNADLLLDVDIAATSPTNANFTLKAPDGAVVFSQQRQLAPGLQQIQFPVAGPQPWTPETPNLYRLEISIAGSVTSHPVGFREVAVVQKQILVNGKPVRLRGMNRHEADPLRGRSLLPGQWEQDLLLFRDANVNLLRTCHYPPALHLAHAADQHGMWIEVEGPFCWENSSSDVSHRAATLSQLAEMVKAWRNHPSVLFWSIANESSWGTNFALGSNMMQQLDPSRPRTFNWMSGSVQTADQSYCQIGVIHYPGFGGATSARNYAARPLYFGEDAHLNAYNRREQMTDPGLRERWGEPFAELWESIWNEPSVLGCSIWSGIDDTFFLDADLTVGYGAWGPVDPWRRPKPELWSVKKVYSPVHVTNAKQPMLTAQSLTLNVQNRGDFLNFNQLTFRWTNGVQSGTVIPNIAPRQSGQIIIAPPLGIAKGSPVELVVTAPNGREVDRFSFATGNPDVVTIQGAAPELITTASTYSVRMGNVTYHLNRTTGNFSWTVGGTMVLVSGPHLLMTPLNSEGNTQMTGPTQYFTPYVQIAQGYTPGAISAATAPDGAITLTVPCSYTEANGSYKYVFAGGKPVQLTYDFTLKTSVNRRQTGVSFDLPTAFDELTWKRNGQWNAYPADHIGRLEGVAKFHYNEGRNAIEIGPRERPTTPWSQDNTPYGSNDFRSTKENIRRASVRSVDRSLNIFAEQDGTHVQVIGLNGVIRASILNYSNAGYERFLQGLASRHYSSLAVGAKLNGSVSFTADTRDASQVQVTPDTSIELIGATVRNGGFEESNVTSPTLVSSNAIPGWETWNGYATATNNTGVYDSVPGGSQALYLQAGGGVVNLTSHVIAAGDVLRYGFTDVYDNSRGQTAMSLVYQDGGSSIAIPGTLLVGATNDPANSSYSATYTVAEGDPWIGKILGVGLKGETPTTNFPEVDNVMLSLVVPADRFAQWASSHGYPTMDRNLLAGMNDDHDARPILIEYLTHGNPAQSDQNPLIGKGNDLLLDLRDLTTEDAIEAHVEFSDDLIHWETRPGDVTPVADQTNLPAGFTRYRIALGRDEDRMFVRLAAQLLSQ